MVFMDPRFHLSEREERKRYELHNNNPQDNGYRRFLCRLADPLCEMLSAGEKGLDFGSGPGPAMSLILQERGFDVTIYDPFFAPDPISTQQRYDFITCTEVIEHFFHPHRELERMLNMLNQGGLLAVMTEVRDPMVDFREWYYPRDPTHVAFYDEMTMRWIATRWRLDVFAPQRNVRIFKKT
jgi:hypothetical protein